VLEACTEVVRVVTVLEQPVCTVVELVGAMVLPAVEVPVEVLAAAMAAHAESLPEKSAPLVGSAAAVEDPVRVLCPTWELATESIFRRQRTSTWVPEVILTLFDQEEISLASSQGAVC